MASYAREPRPYELMAILLPELADEELTGAIDRVSEYITVETGAIKEILHDSPWGRRRLAYTIRFNGQDYRDGYYVIWHFDLEPSRMTEIERELKLDTRVIRYLIVHDDPKWGSQIEREQVAASKAEAAAEAERAASGESAQPAADTAAAPPAGDDAPVADAAPVEQPPIGTAEAAAAEAPAAPESEAASSAPVAGASGEEVTGVVADTTGAAVTAPVDDAAAISGDADTDAEQQEEV